MNKQPVIKIAVFGYGSLTRFCIREMLKRNIEVRLYAPTSKKNYFNAIGFDSFENVKSVLIDDIQSEELYRELDAWTPDLIMSIVFNKKIPQRIAALAKYMAVNMHPADRPQYRTANAWFWPLRQGEKKSAISIHTLTQEWDKGDIVYKKEFALSRYETQGFYMNRVNMIGVTVINEFLDLVEQDDIRIVKPEGDDAYYTKPSAKDFEIDWTQTDIEIDALIRACNPNTLAYTEVFNLFSDIIEVEITELEATTPGIASVQNDNLYISASNRQLKINVLSIKGVGIFTGPRFIKLFNGVVV